MMRCFVQPTGTFSRAMCRIANALKRYAPPHITFVDNEAQADLVVMYVIGLDYIGRATRLVANGQRFAAVQCCVRTTELTVESEWYDFWRQAELVWSYLDLRASAARAGFNFMYAPLGLDDAFVEQPLITPPRRSMVITTGYVTGESAEAIEEVWIAANRLGMEAVHVGPPKVEGMKQPPNWRHIAPDDKQLAQLYRTAKFVAALRHKEGFECPAAEAAACGTLPVVFDQPCMRAWYDDLAAFVPDCSGSLLVNYLAEVLTGNDRVYNFGYNGLLPRIARARFNWERICTAFWRRIEAGKQAGDEGVKETAYAS